MNSQADFSAFHMYTQTGLSHVQSSRNNEDFCCFSRQGNYVAVALADGVSSCLQSETGAQLGARVAAETLVAFADIFMVSKKGQILNFILRQIEYVLTKEAEIQSCSPEDFAAGLACILLNVQTREILALSRGNVMVLADRAGSFRLLLPVEDDCCGIHTIADRKAAWSFVSYEILPADTRIWLFSDGAWKPICSNDLLWDKFSKTRQLYGQADTFFCELMPWDDCTYCTLDLNILTG